MKNQSHPLFVRLQNPVFQAIMILAAVLVVNLGALIFREIGMSGEQRFPWTAAAAFVLFFSALNAVMSVFSKNTDNYWSRSIICFVGLAGAGGLLAFLFSGLTMNEAGSYKWIYIVLTIGYLVFMLILNAMRRIVDFAQREEWNQPRLRHKKKRQ